MSHFKPLTATITRGALGARRAVRGVTLIELMIGVAIVGILSSIAIPSYNDYIRRARRADTQSFMQDVAARQTQFLSDRRAYADSITDAVADGGMALTIPTNVSTYYTVVLAADNTAPPTFTVTATPTTRQSADKCGTLTINSNNAKTNSTGSKCW